MTAVGHAALVPAGLTSGRDHQHGRRNSHQAPLIYLKSHRSSLSDQPNKIRSSFPLPATSVHFLAKIPQIPARRHRHCFAVAAESECASRGTGSRSRSDPFGAGNGAVSVVCWEGASCVGGLRRESAMAGAARDGRVAPVLPLATLIGRELRGDGLERPLVRYGHSGFAKRGEDYFLIKPDCLRVPDDPSSAFSVFAVFDGHNGVSAAVFSKEHLLEHVMSAVPQGISREDWLQALPRALVAGFVKTDIDFQRKGETSGTTATLVVVDGLTVTVASVGDSRCIVDTNGGEVSLLTVDHRLEENAEERERVTASGGEVSRLNLCGGQEVGPLRCWPGGLCLSRSIGDTDVGEFIVPIPHVKQVKLPNTGGRLIIASDGIWDAVSSETAAQVCRGLPADLAAKLVVKQALKTSGLKDDTTCVVVDVIPSDHCSTPPLSPKKNQNRLRSLLMGRRSHSSVGKHGGKSALLGSVEELFEEGSAILEERLGRNLQTNANMPPFRCAICQVDQGPFEDLMTDNIGSCCPAPSTPWSGPYLCSGCRKKKDAMEGKRSSRATTCR